MEENGNNNPQITPEVQALIDKQVNEAVEKVNKEWDEKFTTKVNEASKSSRERYERELAKAKMSEEERIKAEQEESFKTLQAERDEARNQVKSLKLDTFIAKNNLPSFVKNDSRLLNATDEDFDKVSKDVLKDYADYSKVVNKANIPNNSPSVKASGDTSSDVAKRNLQRAGVRTR